MGESAQLIQPGRRNGRSGRGADQGRGASARVVLPFGSTGLQQFFDMAGEQFEILVLVVVSGNFDDFRLVDA